ncbi:MAG: RHS repeat-associated core domain-containing protein [Pirellulales bacterium]
MYDPQIGRFIQPDFLGLAADENTYRYVGNSPTNYVDPSGQQRVIYEDKGVGHHWVPVSVFMQPQIRVRLSDEAVQYAAGAYTTEMDPAHCYTTYGGVKHSEYNRYVREELKKFIDARKSKAKLTGQEMKKFVELIRQGKGANGQQHAQISAFNNAISQQIKTPAKPGKFQEIVELGKKYMQTSRFKLLATAAVLLGALADAAVSHAQILTCTAKSHNYRLALEALERGDLTTARARLIGENDSLYWDIFEGAGAHPALNFQKAIEAAFERAKEADND